MGKAAKAADLFFTITTTTMIELWIDEEYSQDVDATLVPPSDVHYEPEHHCYRVIIRHVNEMHWLTQDWGTIAEHFGFQPESVVYCC